MDPLSMTTACLSLLSAISAATHLVIDFIVTCREARDDIIAVSRELTDLDITLHILKHEAEANELRQLPEGLRQYIRDIMVNCTTVLTDLHALLREYQGTGLGLATKWALVGCKEATKIRASLEVHKRTLSLVVETTTLHMTRVIATDVSQVIHDSTIIKENTMKIVEQLAKQDKILEQIAWDRAVLSQGSATDQRTLTMIDECFENLTDYADSICGDSVSEDVAEEMRVHWDGSGSSALISNNLKPSPAVLVETRDIMTLVIGNTHRLVEPKAGSPNKHLWTFYLLTSRPEIIKEVRVYLVSSFTVNFDLQIVAEVLINRFHTQHETFHPPNRIFNSPPYKITCTGWGYFTIGVQVILKRGYMWCEVDGSVLELDWELDIRSMGSSASHEYSVRRDSR